MPRRSALSNGMVHGMLSAMLLRARRCMSQRTSWWTWAPWAPTCACPSSWASGARPGSRLGLCAVCLCSGTALSHLCSIAACTPTAEQIGQVMTGKVGDERWLMRSRPARGGKGQGKSFQTELAMKKLGIEPVIMSAGPPPAHCAVAAGYAVLCAGRTPLRATAVLQPCWSRAHCLRACTSRAYLLL